MQITFGFIYYLIGLMVGVSLLMLVCLRRRARRLLLQVSEKIDLAENHMAFTAIYFVFALLGAVFVDSIWSYWTYYSETNFGTLALNQKPRSSPSKTTTTPATSTDKPICPCSGNAANTSSTREISCWHLPYFSSLMFSVNSGTDF